MKADGKIFNTVGCKRRDICKQPLQATGFGSREINLAKMNTEGLH